MLAETPEQEPARACRLLPLEPQVLEGPCVGVVDVHCVDDGYDDAVYSLAEHSSLGHSSAFNNTMSESSHRRSYHPSSSVRENTSYKPIATSNQENINFSSTILPSSSSSSSVMSKQVTSLMIPVTL
jgi:hypothetical protein